MPHDSNGFFLESLSGPSVDGELTTEADVLEIVIFSQAQVVGAGRDQWIEVDDGRGPKGDQGDTGPSGESIAFEHVQSVASGTWTIEIPIAFDRVPGVSVYLNTGEEVEADVVASSTQVTITFPSPTAGVALLN